MSGAISMSAGWTVEFAGAEGQTPVGHLAALSIVFQPPVSQAQKLRQGRLHLQGGFRHPAVPDVADAYLRLVETGESRAPDDEGGGSLENTENIRGGSDNRSKA